MKAFVIHQYSKTAPLQVAELPTPAVNANQVLVAIRAASLNPVDYKIKEGGLKFILPLSFPVIMGQDFAGTIVAVGSAVRNFKVSDDVYARPNHFHTGTLAEYIAVDAGEIALKPKNLSMEEAASIPLVALTAWQAFVDRTHVKPSDKVFIQAGSGGGGTIAIQIANYLGATVATTASRPNFPWLKALGADVLIDYKTEDFEKELTDYDVVLNTQDQKNARKVNPYRKAGRSCSLHLRPANARFCQ